MTTVRSLVLRTAGTNCDRETVHALERAGARVDLLHLHKVMERPERILDYRLLVFPGGFTYGDDIASGVVFSVEMRRSVLPNVRKLVDDGGLVLGICNGFQILVRAGLLPGTATDGRMQASLAPNVSGKFECRWVRLEATTDQSAFLSRGQVIECPVAHAEGRLVLGSDDLLGDLENSGQLALRYTPPEGTASGDDPDSSGYPWNPNGSPAHVAGICDPTGRILGLMPHPERNIEPWHHPHWTRDAGNDGGDRAGAGISIFVNGVRAARG